MESRTYSHSKRMLSLNKPYRMSMHPLAAVWQILWQLFLAPDAWAVNTLAFLAGRAGIVGEAYPFGVALFFIVLKAGSRVRSLSAAISVLVGLGTVAGPERVLSIAAAMAAASFYHAAQPKSDDTAAWPGALALSGLLAICRLGEAWLTGMTARGVTTVFLEALMVMLAALLFAPLVSLARTGLPYRLHTEQLVSVGLAAVVVGIGLGGVQIGQYQPAEVWNRWVTLVAALLGHGAIGAAQGAALGLMAEISGSGLLGGGAGLYGISGLLGGLFSQSGRLGVAVGFFLGNLIGSVQAQTGESIALGFVHTVLAMVLFFLTPDTLIYRLARAIPGTEAEAQLAAGREERLRAAVTERLDQLAQVFHEMAKAFAEVGCDSQAAGELNSPWQRRISETREIVPRQLSGLGHIIANASAHLRLDTAKGDELEVRVGEELARRRIRYSNLRVRHAGGNHPEVSFVYENPCDGQGRCKKQAAQAVTAALVETYTPWQVECGGRKGGCAIRLLPERPLDVIVRAATLAKVPGGVSGDTYSRVELADGKVAVLLSDGMGAGERAARESKATVAMLQQLISAGFDREFAVQTVNSVLLLRSPEETYATVDLVVIDLFTGELEFLKIGSAPSFIQHSKDIEIVRSSSLPVGILSDIEVTRKSRLLRPGDLLVMMTDGVIDSLPARPNREEWLARYLRRSACADAEQLAEDLLAYAASVAGDQRDDMTVVVVKLVRRTAGAGLADEGDLPVFSRGVAMK